MLTFLIGKKQRAIAWFFFIIFYTDIIGAAYASNKMYAPIITFTNYSSGGHTYNNYTYEPPKIEARLVSRNDLTKKPIALTEHLKNIPDFVKSLIPATPVIELNKLSNKLDSAGPGPGQPEMASFKSVGADNMVNLFTGDFSYNIPLLDVDGYPVNIFYNAGPSMDQEASWVGLGWNINPGTINRNMRGLPDDFDGSSNVKKEMSMKPDVTVGVNAATTSELVGLPFAGTASAGIFYNNKRGGGMEAGISGEFNANKKLSKKNTDDKTTMDTIKFGLVLSLDNNSQSGLTPSVTFQANLLAKDKSKLAGLSTSIDFNSRSGLGDLRLSGELPTYAFTNKGMQSLGATSYDGLLSTSISFARSSFTPTIRMPITSFNATFRLKLGDAQKIRFKNVEAISGYYSKSTIANKYKLQERPAYGYIYYEKANTNKNALLDFNRLNDGSYTLKTPVLSIPVYTYDVFNITGEGTGGSFRGFRGNMGYVRDPYMRTNSGKMNLQLDLGAKKLLHTGTVVGGVYSSTTVQGWNEENELKHSAQFQPSIENIQKGFYFKNPGEKAIIDEDYYQNMGGDRMMRPVMDDPANTGAPFSSPKTTLQSKFQLYNARKQPTNIIDITATNNYREKRDKRTQVISFLTAEEADRVGLDRYIKSYKQNEFKPGACPDDFRTSDYLTTIKRYQSGSSIQDAMYRKANHISEITVQEGSKRYIYGLPVYQTTQVETTISVNDNMPDIKGLVGYNPTQMTSSGNTEGRDGLYQRETMPAYAHSFLLTAILSPDYSDILGDGITDDDLGTAIKFNYSRPDKIAGPEGNSWPSMKWKMPMELSMANFNRGLITDERDNKALTTYGEKELWYTHSIESKNMIATFRVSNRDDGYGVKGIHGDLETTPGAACQKKLDRIDLYAKADFVKDPLKAKPIKTVHFTYTYKLCKNYKMNKDNNGKLTLASIYFTYNNNNHVKSKYLFKYAEQEDASTAVYNPTEIDRWGTYKPRIQNPNVASNEDYTYTNQNKAQSDANAATWSLNKILLPSGARIDIDYEADDYAYVQNKRAAQMTKIVGFGVDFNATPEYNLFKPSLVYPWNFSSSDYKFVFFENNAGATNPTEVAKYYLQDLKQLLLKLWVKVPKSAAGLAGYEPMFVYCNIEEFGVVPNNSNLFYVKVGTAARNQGSQIMETVYQFLRDQLPGKAYPGSDIGNSSAVRQIVMALFAMANNLRTGITGFENNARRDGWCKEVDPILSMARLSAPNFKKLGGGHRVKRIRILDNWKKMLTKEGEPAPPNIDSYYGQEYDYTTKEIVNRQEKIISSGVASYEPGVGNEENPFREVLQYGAHNTLAPTQNSNIELPIAETFFPAPSVGYSRVTVKSIHRKNNPNPADNKNIKSGVGMQETNYYTTKDFPILSEWSDMSPVTRNHFKPSAINKIFNFSQKEYMTLVQGFRVVLNDMNGKIKMQASYAETDLKNPINKTSYYYRINKVGENKFKLNNVVPTVAGADGVITNKLVGKDIEVMTDFREHFTTTRSMQKPINLEFFKQMVGQYTIPIAIPSLFKSVFRDEALFRSATTLKIVNEYGILDSVSNFDKGSLVGTKNLVYNAETGDVMVSRTQNEFNKPIYNFNYPAYWAVDDMGPAYKNIDATFKNLIFRHGKIDAGIKLADMVKYFASGDEIYVVDKSATGVLEHTACDPNGLVCNPLPKSNEFRIWALDVTKDVRNIDKEFIFIDRNGVPYNAADADIRIIRSGRRNMLDASVGSITSMANPILLDANNNYDKILISNTTDVVNTGAMEYKEKWKVQDAFKAEKITTTIIKKAPVTPLTLYPIESHSTTGSFYIPFLPYPPPPFPLLPVPNPFVPGFNIFEQSYSVLGSTPFTARNGFKGINIRVPTPIGPRDVLSFIPYNQKSWLRFDLSNLSSNTLLKSAKLSLYSHTALHTLPIQNAHFFNNPHNLQTFADNRFVISRALTNTWPGANTGQWANLFYQDPPSGNDRVIVGQPSSGTFDYAKISNSSVDDRIEVKNLVNGMLRDKDYPGRNYVPAFKIAELDYNPVSFWGEPRVCFNAELNPVNTAERARPKLELGIIRCDIAYEDPDDIPPGQEVGDCVQTTVVTNCLSIFDGNFVNPYVHGLLGNWRPLKSHVYYGERREQDPTVPTTNIAKDGIIKEFEPFWNFALPTATEKMITKTNSAKWTWNSEITQYNRKGAELENKDPLKRFNASVYGYNEALPVAVVNNSKLRQSAFDGFEDYFFTDQTCNLDCKPNKRHFNTGIKTLRLETKFAHSGTYSLRTPDNTSTDPKTSIEIPISADNEADNANTPDIRIELNKVVTNFPSMRLEGDGLSGFYAGNGGTFGRVDPLIFLDYYHNRWNGEYTSNPDPLPFPLSHDGGNMVAWTGALLVEKSGMYSFACLGLPDDIVVIYINGVPVFNQTPLIDIPLTAGVPATVFVSFADGYMGDLPWASNRGHVDFSWKPVCANNYEFVPQKNMYSSLQAAQEDVFNTIPYVCLKVNKIKPLSNFLIDSFNLIHDKKMIASVWVKKGDIDCRCPQYDGFTISLRAMDVGSTVLATFLPKGPIIEGWQLFETEFTVPASGDKIEFFIDNSTTAGKVYIDDLRFHPYNSNMKSFVYSPYNLKPVAELDENNYATFYEYDNDGTLNRVKKETKLGIKTIQETRSSLQKSVNDF
jgi:hypothetical protein